MDRVARPRHGLYLHRVREARRGWKSSSLCPCCDRARGRTARPQQCRQHRAGAGCDRYAGRSDFRRDRRLDQASAVPAGAAMSNISGRYAIVGVGESDVGRRLGRSGMALQLEAAKRALADAGLNNAIDGVITRPTMPSRLSTIGGACRADGYRAPLFHRYRAERRSDRGDGARCRRSDRGRALHDGVDRERRRADLARRSSPRRLGELDRRFREAVRHVERARKLCARGAPPHA